jgi:WD40 repeat protein
MLPTLGQPFVSPDGRRAGVLVWGRGGIAGFGLWDTASGQSLPSYTRSPHTWGKPIPFAFDPGGHLVVAHDADSVVICSEPQQRSLKLKGVNGSLSLIAVSPDGQRLAGATGDRSELKELAVWDLTTGVKVFGVRPRLQDVGGLAFSPDGVFIVGYGAATATVVWQAATGAEFRVLDACSKAVFSPDSHLLAGQLSATTLTIWDLLTGEEVRPRIAHNSPVTAMAFEESGKRLATGCQNGAVYVWVVP